VLLVAVAAVECCSASSALASAAAIELRTAANAALDTAAFLFGTVAHAVWCDREMCYAGSGKVTAATFEASLQKCD
jgi:predicted lipoprotein